MKTECGHTPAGWLNTEKVGKATEQPETHRQEAPVQSATTVLENGQFLSLKHTLSHNSVISLLDTSPGGMKTELQEDLQSNVYCSLISHVSNLETKKL